MIFYKNLMLLLLPCDSACQRDSPPISQTDNSLLMQSKTFVCATKQVASQRRATRGPPGVTAWGMNVDMGTPDGEGVHHIVHPCFLSLTNFCFCIHSMIN